MIDIDNELNQIKSNVHEIKSALDIYDLKNLRRILILSDEIQDHAKKIGEKANIASLEIRKEKEWNLVIFAILKIETVKLM